MLPSTFSINTDKPQKDYLCYALAGNRIFDGAGQMQNVYLGEGDPEVLKKIRWEQRVLELTNDYSNGEINMYNGNTPNYYISGNTHISGDLYHPDTNQSAVAVLTFQVTDKDGNIVYQNKITGVASEGKSLADYWEKAAQDINAYLQNAINRPKKTN